jgi:hypothetical protein
MLLEKVLDIVEKRVPITGNTRIGKRLRQYRGINYLVLGENEPPDKHGIPKELEAYGRGWQSRRTGQIVIDGGRSGSSSGHPNDATNAFYWGADYDKNVMYVRARNEADEQFLENNIEHILELIFKRLPRP